MGEKCYRYFSDIRLRIDNNIETGYRVGEK